MAWRLRCETEEEAIGWQATLVARDPSARVEEDASGFAVICDDEAHAKKVYHALSQRLAHQVDRELRRELATKQLRSRNSLLAMAAVALLFCLTLLAYYSK